MAKPALNGQSLKQHIMKSQIDKIDKWMKKNYVFTCSILP